MPPLRLSDDELDAVMLAARPLRPHDRDAFLQEVANALAGCSEIGPPHRVRPARNLTLRQRRFRRRAWGINATSRRPNGCVWVMTSGVGLSRRRLQPLWVRDDMRIFTIATVKTLANQRASRFRTIQVYPKSAARKHAQALALSNAHISRLWRQRAFSESVKTGKACRA